MQHIAHNQTKMFNNSIFIIINIVGRYADIEYRDRPTLFTIAQTNYLKLCYIVIKKKNTNQNMLV